MVAMIITLVCLLGLLKSVGIITETNVRNQMRDEAVQVGEKALNNLMATGNDVADSSIPQFLNYSVQSNLRGVNKYYVITASRTTIAGPAGSSNSKQVIVRVRWMYKNISTVHMISAIKSNQ
jgi:hypothetical protein